jgi:hypothetical protein
MDESFIAAVDTYWSVFRTFQLGFSSALSISFHMRISPPAWLNDEFTSIPGLFNGVAH